MLSLPSRSDLKHDLAAVGRPGGLAVVAAAVDQDLLVAPIRVHDPDLPIATDLPLPEDLRPVRREGRKAIIVGAGRNCVRLLPSHPSTRCPTGCWCRPGPSGRISCSGPARRPRRSYLARPGRRGRASRCCRRGRPCRYRRCARTRSRPASAARASGPPSSVSSVFWTTEMFRRRVRVGRAALDEVHVEDVVVGGGAGRVAVGADTGVDLVTQTAIERSPKLSFRVSLVVIRIWSICPSAS